MRGWDEDKGPDDLGGRCGASLACHVRDVLLHAARDGGSGHRHAQDGGEGDEQGGQVVAGSVRRGVLERLPDKAGMDHRRTSARGQIRITNIPMDERTARMLRHEADLAEPARLAYEHDAPAHEAAFFGHYTPSKARVQGLLEYALAHDHDPFWRALARRLSTASGSPWNEAVAAAAETGSTWNTDARIRRVVYDALYQGRLPGRRQPLPAYDGHRDGRSA